RPGGKRLLPDQDVTAAHAAARILGCDPARQMKPERDHFAAVPPHTPDIAVRRGANLLAVHVLVSLPPEAVRRPGERRRSIEFADVVDVDANVDEAAVAPAR